MKASDYNGDLKKFLRLYKFQPCLTSKLDAIGSIPFDQKIINEIVLWKVNRYADFPERLCEEINEMSRLSPGEHRNASFVLEIMLDVRGVDLPMASTILRFRNPNVFQIIDRHAYRALCGKSLKIYYTTSKSTKISIYFDYLDNLFRFCKERDLPFITSDRVLYVFDKEFNGSLQEKIGE